MTLGLLLSTSSFAKPLILDASGNEVEQEYINKPLYATNLIAVNLTETDLTRTVLTNTKYSSITGEHITLNNVSFATFSGDDLTGEGLYKGLVVGGGNTLTNSTSGAIIGDNIKVLGSYSSRVWDEETKQTIHNSATRRVFATGINHEVLDSQNSIITGDGNAGAGFYNNIVGGFQNNISATNSILTGYKNNVGRITVGEKEVTVNDNQQVLVVPEYKGHTASRNVVSGTENNIYSARNSVITGVYNDLNTVERSFIGGFENTLERVKENGDETDDGLDNRIINSLVVGSYNKIKNERGEDAVFNNGLLSGTNNTVSGFQIIAGGGDNVVDSSYNAIISGRGANIKNLNESLSLTLYSNITTAQQGSYIGGQNNEAGIISSSILSGALNNVSSSATRSIISGGSNKNKNSYNSILSGYKNNIFESVNSVAVGLRNSIETIKNGSYAGGWLNSGYDVDSAISSGAKNNFTELNYSLLTGLGNNLSGAAYQSIIGGEENTLTLGSEIYSSLMTGSRNTASGTIDSSVVSSRDSALGKVEVSSISGSNITLSKTSETLASIIGGDNHTTNSNVKTSLIVGSKNNVDTGGLTDSLISGGSNMIYGGSNNTILGSQNALEKFTAPISDGKEVYTINNSTAIGNANKVEMDNSVALGNNNWVAVENGIAIGNNATANRQAGSVGWYYGEEAPENVAFTSTEVAIAVGSTAANSLDGKDHLAQITGVAAGTEDTDAVNVAQLRTFAEKTQEDIQNIQGDVNTINETIDKGYNFKTDDGTVVNKKLGDTININGGANIQTQVNNGGLEIALKDDIELNSVKVGDVVMSADGINLGGNTISNLADGVRDGDAVNVKQLKQSQVSLSGSDKVQLTETSGDNGKTYTINVATTEVKAGDQNINIEEIKGDKGQSIYVATLNNKLDGIASIGNGDNKITFETIEASNPDDYAYGVNVNGARVINIASPVDGTDAANKDYVDSVRTTVTSKNNSIKIVKTEDGALNYDLSIETGSDYLTIADGKVDLSDNAKNEIQQIDKGYNFQTDGGTIVNKKLGDTINVAGGKNITTKTENGNVIILLDDDIEVESVKANTIETENIKVGKVKITSEGIDAGGKVISNVADGEISESSTNAVNGRQLNAVQKQVDANTNNIASNTNRIKDLEGRAGNMERRVDKLEHKVEQNKREANAGIASTAALANIPQVMSAGKSGLGVGVGHREGQSAVAIGYSRASDNAHHIIKISAGVDTQHKGTFGAGYMYQW